MISFEHIQLYYKVLFNTADTLLLKNKRKGTLLSYRVPYLILVLLYDRDIEDILRCAVRDLCGAADHIAADDTSGGEESLGCCFLARLCQQDRSIDLIGQRTCTEAVREVMRVGDRSVGRRSKEDLGDLYRGLIASGTLDTGRLPVGRDRVFQLCRNSTVSADDVEERVLMGIQEVLLGIIQDTLLTVDE